MGPMSIGIDLSSLGRGKWRLRERAPSPLPEDFKELKNERITIRPEVITTYNMIQCIYMYAYNYLCIYIYIL